MFMRLQETQGFLNAGPADSFPNEGTLITEITFGANIDPEERFPGYGLYKVVHNTGEENYFLNTMLILSFRCPVLRGVKSTAGTFNIIYVPPHHQMLHLVLLSLLPGSHNSNQLEHAGPSHVAMNPTKRSV